MQYKNTEDAPHTSFNLQGQNIKNPRDSIEARVFMVLKK